MREWGPWGQLSKSMSRNKFQKKWWDGSFFILQRKVVKLSEQLHFWTIYVVDRKKPSLSLRKQLWLHLNISSMETQVHPAHANVRHSSACLEDVYCSWLKHSLCVSFIDDCCRITMEMHGAQKHHETSLQRIDSVQRCQEDLTKMQLFSSRMKTPTTHQVPSCSCQIFKHQDHQVEHSLWHSWTTWSSPFFGWSFHISGMDFLTLAVFFCGWNHPLSVAAAAAAARWCWRLRSWGHTSQASARHITPPCSLTTKSPAAQGIKTWENMGKLPSGKLT